jgi:hypothetical protein
MSPPVEKIRFPPYMWFVFANTLVSPQIVNVLELRRKERKELEALLHRRTRTYEELDAEYKCVEQGLDPKTAADQSGLLRTE